LDISTTPIQFSLVLASALLAAVIGLLATLRRGHWLTTLIFSASFLSIAAFQAGTLGILHAETQAAAHNWATYLARTSALASWLWLSLSVVLARSDPWAQIRNASAYLTLALVGCIAMSFAAGSPHVVRDVVGHGSDAVVVLGTMGKVYLMYLVVAMVAVVMNLERMLRGAHASAQRRLRPMFLAFLVAILSELLVVSGGLLYSGLRVEWLSAAAAPMFASGAVTAMALARRRLSDIAVPVARPVIYYSSVSLTLAGVFLLTMAVLSKVLPVLSPEWKRIVSLGFYLLAGGGGLLLTLSPRASRAIKRFIDRNFYANRYDYRREWERVSSSISPTALPEDVARQIDSLVCTVFEAERAAVYLRDGARGSFRRVRGPQGMPDAIEADNPLVVELTRTRVPLAFAEADRDLDLVPIAVVNRGAVQALTAAVAAPLAVGEEVVGLLWLSEKRTDEDYTYEDIEFLGAMARQLAAAVWFAVQAEQLAETRQLESMNRLSTHVLHDIKNHVSGLSLVVENARRHMANPEFQRDAMAVVERTVESLRELMNQVSGVGRPPEVKPVPCDVRALVDAAVATSGLGTAPTDRTRIDVRGRVAEPLMLDRGLIHRVLVNLLTNARESLTGGADEGEIELALAFTPAPGGAEGELEIVVRDNGRGMSEEFMRASLFRPFATTKSNGLGLGLAQCKSIVEAHGGKITAESRAGRGSTFHILLTVAVAASDTTPERGTESFRKAAI